MMDTERINSKLLLLCGKAITSVDPGRGRRRRGQINDQYTEDQQSTFTFAWKGDCLLLILGGRSTINTERINSQLSLSHGRSTVGNHTFKMCSDSNAVTLVQKLRSLCPSDILCGAWVGH